MAKWETSGIALWYSSLILDTFHQSSVIDQVPKCNLWVVLCIRESWGYEAPLFYTQVIEVPVWHFQGLIPHKPIDSRFVYYKQS